MKHQYFGDVNDYRKYGLLRTLAKDDIHILINWMLTPNDGSADGRRMEADKMIAPSRKDLFLSKPINPIH